jgi:SAM-dependent methyltransferase
MLSWFESHQVEGALWEQWMREVQRHEFENIIRLVPLSRSAQVLELGCGEGFQLGLLRKRFDHVFAIDPERRPDDARGFVVSTAEALPFPGNFFDLVYSRCVLEHVSSRSQVMEEAARVLRPGGYMAHIVPAPFWKATSVLLNPFAYPLHAMGKWSSLRRLARETSAVHGDKQEQAGNREKNSPQAGRPQFSRVLQRWLLPEVHGTYPSHRAEYRAYSRKRWAGIFAHPALALIAQVPLLSYGAFGLLRFHGLAWRERLGRCGLAGSQAFVLRKNDFGFP